MLFQGIKQQRAVSETLHTTVKYFHFGIVYRGIHLSQCHISPPTKENMARIFPSKKYEMNFPNVGKHKISFSKFTKCEIYFANLQNSGYITKNKIWRDQYVKYFSNIRLQIRDENLHRQKSRKPSLEAFSQSRTVSGIEPSILSIGNIFLKWFLWFFSVFFLLKVVF